MDKDYKRVLSKATQLVKTKLENKVDKNGEPLFCHCKRVSNLGENYEEQIVGILHDILEDSDTEVKDLVEIGFTKKVIDAVICLTRKKNEEYFNYIKRVSFNKLARNVKMNDLKDNMDITRFKCLKQENLSLLNRYLKAFNILKAISNIEKDKEILKSLSYPNGYKYIVNIREEELETFENFLFERGFTNCIGEKEFVDFFKRLNETEKKFTKTLPIGLFKPNKWCKSHFFQRVDMIKEGNFMDFKQFKSHFQ